MELEVGERILSEKWLRNENVIISKFRNITHKIRRTLDKTIINETAVREISQELGCFQSLIYLPQPTGHFKCVAEHIQELSTSDFVSCIGSVIRPDLGFISRVISQRETIVISKGHYEMEELFTELNLKDMPIGFLIHDIMAVRVPMGPDTYGIIILLWDMDSLDSDEVHSKTNILTDIAEQVGIALQQTLLMDQEKVN